MQNILGGNRFGPDAAFGKGHILRHKRVQVVADHQHIQMLGNGIDCVGPGRVGGGRQNVGEGGDADDVRCVAAPRALRVIGVDCAPGDGLNRALHITRFVERIRVDGDLHVEFVGYREAGVDGRGRRAPVLVELQPARTSPQLLG